MEHSRKEHGVVKGSHEHYSDKSLCEIEVELPAKKSEKKPKKGEVVLPGFAPSRHVTVPKEASRHYAIGDAVEVETTIRHFGKKGNRPGAGEEKSS